MKSSIKIQNLTKKYGDKTAVDAISFEINEGEIFALIGPNGAGKSTTLKMLATILIPTSGEASIFGMDLKKEAEKIRKVITYLPEDAGAYKSMSGIDYLNFMASIYSDSKEQKNRLVEEAKSINELGDRLKDKVNTYSKGMARKLLLSRALMVSPKLTILDEPTSGLDVVNAIEVRNIIKEQSKRGTTVILSSHNMLEIEFLSNRVGIINKGKLLEIGTPEFLKKEYKAKNLEEVFYAISNI